MFLIDKFQQFYAEVVRVRGRVAEGTWVFDAERPALPAEASVDLSPTSVFRKLSSMLERQTLEAGREGGDFAVAVYRRAQFAMAALADDIFLNLEWAGKREWRDHLLETRLFGTHRAGEELFEEIEKLLRDRDSLYGELARIYLLVLALGFQGKYRGRPEAEQEIEAYRRRLFRFVFGRDPQVTRGADQVVPQAYGATLDEARVIQLPYLRPWMVAIAAILAIWIAGSHLLWRKAVNELAPIVAAIHGEQKAGAR